jgi:hypothetical protein
VTNGASIDTQEDRKYENRTDDRKSDNSDNSSNNTNNSSTNTIIYNNTTEKEDVLTSVGITNIKVNSKGDLIITLSDNSSVVVGNTKERNALASEKEIKDSGYVESYFFNVPYEDFVALKIDDQTVPDGAYSVTSLGDGILVTILQDATTNSSRMEIETSSSNVSTALNKRPSSVPTWLMLLFGVWNALLTGGFVVMAKRFAQLKNKIG